jgi:hypothetical protein
MLTDFALLMLLAFGFWVLTLVGLFLIDQARLRHEHKAAPDQARGHDDAKPLWP